MVIRCMSAAHLLRIYISQSSDSDTLYRIMKQYRTVKVSAASAAFLEDFFKKITRSEKTQIQQRGKHIQIVFTIFKIENQVCF